MALRNAFENVATEATLAEVADNTNGVSTEATLAAVRDMLNNRASSNGNAHLVSGNRARYRREFNDPALPSFNVVTGTGMAISVANSALVITTGTTANQTTTLTTKDTFTVPFKAQFALKTTHKQINQEIYAECVAVNADGSVDETVVAAWRIAGVDNTTTSNARVETRNGGTVRSQSGNLTVNTFTGDTIFEIVLESDEVQFSSRPTDNTTSRSGATTRNSVSPDPNRLYALRYRIVNGATAPAASATITSQFITCIDYAEFQTEITAGPGHANPGQSIPVMVSGGTVGIGNNSIQASTSVTGTNVAKVLSTATTNATLVKNSVGRLYGYQLANTTASWRYMKFYNTTTAPVVGTTVPIYTVPIPPNTTSDLTQTVPISHATGISYAITANPADNDTTAVGAGDVVGYITFI